MLGNEKGERFFAVFFSIRNKSIVGNASVYIQTGSGHFNAKQAIIDFIADSDRFKPSDVSITGFNELTEEDFCQLSC